MYVPHLLQLFVCGWTFKLFPCLAIMNSANVNTAVCVSVPGGSQAKNLPASAGDAGLLPGLGRFPGERNGNSLQYSCLQNPMDRGTWCATIHGVAKSSVQFSSVV